MHLGKDIIWDQNDDTKDKYKQFHCTLLFLDTTLILRFVCIICLTPGEVWQIKWFKYTYVAYKHTRSFGCHACPFKGTYLFFILLDVSIQALTGLRYISSSNLS